VLAIVPSIALAGDQATQPLVWWQVVTGVLAIPAAILGLVYSFFQIQKTRLETRKIALELQRTEQEFRVTIGPVERRGPHRGALIVGYLLLASGSILGYTLLFSGTTLLPLTPDQTTLIYCLISPVFVAQLTIPLAWSRFRSFVLTSGTIALWAILTPLIATGIFGIALLIFVAFNLPVGSIQLIGLTPQFLMFATALSATLLNVATVQIAMRMIVFESNNSTG
jgi:hypothetical protein